MTKYIAVLTVAAALAAPTAAHASAPLPCLKALATAEQASQALIVVIKAEAHHKARIALQSERHYSALRKMFVRESKECRASHAQPSSPVSPVVAPTTAADPVSTTPLSSASTDSEGSETHECETPAEITYLEENDGLTHEEAVGESEWISECT